MVKEDSNVILITEDDIINSVTKFLRECDCDELARMVGEVFGGFCHYDSEDKYRFYPNQNYAGEFNKQKRKQKNLPKNEI